MIKAKISMVAVMLIFGSIGLFVRNIDLSSSEIALFRGVIGSLFLLAASLLLRKKINFKSSKKNLVLLLFSGAALGLNWIFLFEAYRYTTISNATLSYYFAPVFVMVLAPLFLKEKFTWKKAISIFAAMVGLSLVVSTSGGNPSINYQHAEGIGFGLLAAAFYASVIITNKFIKNLSDFETTLAQLVLASLVLMPYVIFTSNMNLSILNGQSIFYLIILGVLHTGLAYLFYFSAIKRLDSQSISIFSYIDPIAAVLLSALILHESMSFLQIIGGMLILGSVFLIERTAPGESEQSIRGSIT